MFCGASPACDTDVESLRQRLTESNPILADGAMGTLLQSWGCRAGHCLELLNLDNPNLVWRVFEAYIQAGAEIVQTNTFGASPLSLERWGLAAHCEDINAAAVRIARQAAGESVWVVGSVGPSGRHLLPFGDLEPDQLAASYHCQISTLLEAGVDAVNVETIMDVEEGVIAVRTARGIAPDMPVFASLTLSRAAGGYYTPFGNGLEQAIRRFEQADARVVGANCSIGMSAMIEIAEKFAELTALPLLMKPNAGLPMVRAGETVWQEMPEQFAEGSKRLRDLGVRIIGGCCGTTPKHIQAMRKALRV